MIFDRLADARARYAGLHPGLDRALEFLSETDLGRIGAERVVIDGDRLFANPGDSLARSRSEAPLENHRRYIDVHCLVEGSEEIGLRPVDGCRAVLTPYDAARDCEFFSDAAEQWVRLSPGDVVAVWPGEAHATLVGEGRIRKVVVKVLLRAAD